MCPTLLTDPRASWNGIWWIVQVPLSQYAYLMLSYHITWHFTAVVLLYIHTVVPVQATLDPACVLDCVKITTCQCVSTTVTYDKMTTCAWQFFSLLLLYLGSTRTILALNLTYFVHPPCSSGLLFMSMIHYIVQVVCFHARPRSVGAHTLVVRSYLNHSHFS